TEEQLGAKVTMFYDAAGRVERTVNPDGSLALVVYGRPAQLATPEVYAPTPWEHYAYDANDNAGRTRSVPDAKNVPESHRNTPSSEVVDALGRVARKVERLGQTAGDELVTETRYDIRGNVIEIHDPLKRSAFAYVYDLANKPLRRESLDAGTRTL